MNDVICQVGTGLRDSIGINRRPFSHIALATAVIWLTMVTMANALLAQDAASKATPSKGTIGPVVTLNDKFVHAGPEMDPRWGLLALELYRQAFLLTARDDFGLVTRDPLLGEAPAGDDVHRFIMNFDAISMLVFARLYTVAPDGTHAPEPFSMKLPVENGLDYVLLSAAAHEAVKKDFADALRQSKLSPAKDLPPDSQESTPLRVNANLNVMTIPTQYSAVRELHQIIRTKGRSPELIAALVRGYANLGVLTEGYFTRMHRAFKARSLLYADRLLQMAPGSSIGHRHKAYALAMLGRQGDALQQIELAQTAEKEEATKDPKAVARPGDEWLGPLEDYCRYRTDRLAESAGRAGSQKQLLWLWHLLAQEHAGTKRQKHNAVDSLLEVSPDCSRAPVTLWLELGSNEGYWAARIVGEQEPAFFARVVEMPDSPPRVAELVKPYRSNLLGRLIKIVADAPAENEDAPPPSDVLPKLIAALRQSAAEDRQEFSWGVFDALVREKIFFEIYQRAFNDRMRQRTSVTEYLQSARPLVADHPLVPMIDSLGVPPDGPREKIAAFLIQTPLDNPDPSTNRLIRRIYEEADKGRGADLWFRMLTNTDVVTPDLKMRLLRIRASQERRNSSQALARISPSDPYSASIRIQETWPQVSFKADKWETEDFAHSAIVLEALGRKRHQLGQFDSARRCLQKALAISPSRTLYELIAETYLAQGNEDQWLATLEKYLKIPKESWWEVTAVRERIVDHFIETKEFDKALSHCIEHAETGATWAMDRAIECYIALEHWENAESYLKRSVEGRSDLAESLKWFVFCRTTGKGELDAARALFEDRLAGLARAPTAKELEPMLLFNILDDQTRPALDVAQLLHSQAPSAPTLWQIAVLADQLEDAKLRDSSLQAMGQVPNADGDLVRLAGEVLPQLNDPNAKFEPDPAKTLATVQQPAARSQLAYSLGRLLQNRKENDLANQFYQLSIDTGPKDRWSNPLPAARLRELESE